MAETGATDAKWQTRAANWPRCHRRQAREHLLANEDAVIPANDLALCRRD